MTTIDNPIRRVARNMLPEGMTYEDTGCDVSPTCLECPLARCKYDLPNNERVNNVWRNQRIFELRKQGVPLQELRRVFKVSGRTISRIIQSGGAPNQMPGKWINGPDQPPIKTVEEIETQYTQRRSNVIPFQRTSSVLVYSGRCKHCGGDVTIDLDLNIDSCLQCRRSQLKPVVYKTKYCEGSRQPARVQYKRNYCPVCRKRVKLNAGTVPHHLPAEAKV